MDTDSRDLSAVENDSAPKRHGSSLPIEVLLNIFQRIGKRDVLSSSTVNRHWSSAAVLVLWQSIDVSSFSNSKSGIRLSLLDRVKPISGGSPTSPSKTAVIATSAGISSTDLPNSSESNGLDYGSIIRTLAARGCDVGSLKSIFSKCRAISTLHLSGATFRAFPKNLSDMSASPFANFADSLRYLDISHTMLPGGRERAILDILALHRNRLECLRMQFTNLRVADIVEFFCGVEHDPEDEEGEGAKDGENDSNDTLSSGVSFPHLKEIFLGGHRGKFTPEQGSQLAQRLGPKLKSLGLFGQDRALMAVFFAKSRELTSLTLGANELRPLGRYATAAQEVVARMISAFKAEQPEMPSNKDTDKDLGSFNTNTGTETLPPTAVLDDPDVPPITHLHLAGGYWTLPFLEACASRLSTTLKHISFTHFAAVFREKAGLLYTRNALDGVAGMVPLLPNLVSLDVHVMRDLLPVGVKGVVELIAASSGAKLRSLRFKSAIEDGSDGFGELEDGIASVQIDALDPLAETIEVLELPSNFFDKPSRFVALLSRLPKLRELIVRDLTKDTSDLFTSLFSDGHEGSRLRGDALLARKQVLNRFGAVAKERSAHLRSRSAVCHLLKGLEGMEEEEEEGERRVVVKEQKRRKKETNDEVAWVQT